MSRKAWLAGLIPAAAAAVALGSIGAALTAPPPTSPTSSPVRTAKARPTRPPAAAIARPTPASGAPRTMAASVHPPTNPPSFNKSFVGEGAAWDKWFISQRVSPNNTMPVGATQKGLESAATRNAFKGRDGHTPSALPKWESLGPSTIVEGDTEVGTPLSPFFSNVSGRVSAIAVDPNNNDTVYVGGAQGGVWKTTHVTPPAPLWTPLTDKEASLAIGSIAIDPNNSNNIFVGTGEPNQSCDSYYGHGILKSNDGGLTWLQINPSIAGVPIFEGRSIDKIIVDSGTGNVFAATQVAFLSSGTEACQIVNGNAPLGGLYRSGDQGEHWAPVQIFPGSTLFFNVTDMALDPSDNSGNTLYVAVADTSASANGVLSGPQSPNGIWKTTNAGSPTPSWTQLTTGLPSPSQNFINRISISIAGDDSVYATYTSGSTQTGIYHSTDGGSTWTMPSYGAGAPNFNNSVNFGHNVNVSASGLVTELGGGTDFATDGSWTGRRFEFDPSGSGSDIRVNVITHVIDPTHLQITPPIDASAHPNSAWAVGSFPGYCDGACSYDMTIGADPADLSGLTLYIGGNQQFYEDNFLDPNSGTHSHWLSTDGGNTWIGISQGGAAGGLHSGDHVIAFDATTSPATVYDGNDGGIWASSDQGANWFDLNTNLAITQFQGISTHPSNPDILLGGAHNNGTVLMDGLDQVEDFNGASGLMTVPPPAWYESDINVGGQTLIDQNASGRMFHTYFSQSNLAIGPAKTIDGGTDTFSGWEFVGGYSLSFFPYTDINYGFYSYYSSYLNNGINMSDPAQFYIPIAQNAAAGQFEPAAPKSVLKPRVLGDPPSVIYLGTNKLYRSPDPYNWLNTIPFFGSYPPAWTVKSPALTNPSDPSDALMAIGVFPNLIGGEEVVYTGSFDGTIYVTKTLDGNPGPATWIRLDNTGSGTLPPPRSVTQILSDPTDVTGQSAFVTFSGFNSNTLSNPGHVFKVTNSFGTPIWADLSGDLPDLPANGVAYDDLNDIIYVASDIGVFESLDGGSHYNYLDTGMPNVTVFGIERNPTTGQVVAGTHGRGAFQLIANGAFDSTPPVCQTGFISQDVNGTEFYNGEASDSGPNDTGISTIAMDLGSTNLAVINQNFTSPQHATYDVHLIQPCLPGDGDVVVTDFGGNTCSVHIHLDANPVMTEDLSLTMTDDTWGGVFDISGNPVLTGSGYDVTAGNPLDYTLTVTNIGPANAGDVVVTDTLPPAGFVAANWSSNLSDLQNHTGGTPCTGTNPISCDLGELDSGQSAFVYITVVPNVPAGTHIVNSATVTDAAPLISTSCDPDSSNNSASDTNLVDASILAPYSLVIDDSSGGNGNGVIEPGESFAIEPGWENNGSAMNAFTGTATSWTGPVDLLVNMYDLTDTSADYGNVLPGSGSFAQVPPLNVSDCTLTVLGCYHATLNPPSQGRPIVHWDTVMSEKLSSGDTKTWVLHVGNSFTDVAPGAPFYYFIEALLHNNVTVGCGTGLNGQGLFCPHSLVTREQMAAFIARAVLGGDFNVPTSEGSGPHPYDCTTSGGSNFTDAPDGYPFCPQINWIYNHGITNGCGPTTFCPTTPIPREQMAALVARERAGSDASVDVSEAVGPHPYDCSSSTPSDWPFTDVPNTNIYCKYIGYLHNQGVVNGYAPGYTTFGPNDTLTREQASAFVINGLLVPAPPDPNAAPMKLYKP